MICQVITDRRALQELGSEWNELLAQSRADSIFLTWEWISGWMETLGGDVTPLVVTARDVDGKLCGLLPAYRTRFALFKAIRFRGLRIIGDGVSGGEYGSVIARRDVEAEATVAVMERLAQRAMRWNVLWIPNAGPTEERSAALLDGVQRLGILLRTRPAEFAQIPLPGSFEAYLQSLPQKIRYQMRRGMERAEREHGARLVRCTNEARLGEALGDLRRLHEARWLRRGQRGTFAEASKRDFYMRVAQSTLRRGWLRLDFLHVDGRAVAAQIGFAYHGVFYELQRGFDPSFPKIPAGLGAALRCMVIQRCIEDGIRTYDFLGEYSGDKQRAGALRTVGRDLLLIRPSLRGALLDWLAVWPRGRYFVERARPSERMVEDLPPMQGAPAQRPEPALVS